MTDDAPETVRPLTPKEIRELLRLAGLSAAEQLDSVYGHDIEAEVICAVRDSHQLRATLERHIGLAEILEDVPGVTIAATSSVTTSGKAATIAIESAPAFDHSDCEHEEEFIDLAICEMDTSVGNVELTALSDCSPGVRQIISAWERLKLVMFETYTIDAREAEEHEAASAERSADEVSLPIPDERRDELQKRLDDACYRFPPDFFDHREKY